MGLRAHITRHTKPEPDIKCPDCEKFFYTTQELRKHHDQSHVVTRHPCEYCGKVYLKSLFLRNHVKHKHLNVDLKIPCTICNRTYPSELNYSRHVQSMHNEVQCPECGENFSNPGKLKRHQRTKHQNLRYRCIVPGCLKEYFMKAKINDHFAKHSEINPFEREHYLNILKKLQPS